MLNVVNGSLAQGGPWGKVGKESSGEGGDGVLVVRGTEPATGRQSQDRRLPRGRAMLQTARETPNS